MIQEQINVDRIIIFSDMQVYDSNRGSYPGMDMGLAHKATERYKRKINPKVWIHSVDLAGYGTSQIAPNGRLNLISGWHDSILNYIKLVEDGLDNQIKSIEGGFNKKGEC